MSRSLRDRHFCICTAFRKHRILVQLCHQPVSLLLLLLNYKLHQRILLHSVLAEICHWSRIHFEAVTSSVQSVQMTVAYVCAVLTCMTDFGNKCERKDKRHTFVRRILTQVPLFCDKIHTCDRSAQLSEDAVDWQDVHQHPRSPSVPLFTLQTALNSTLHLQTPRTCITTATLHGLNPNVLLHNK